MTEQPLCHTTHPDVANRLKRAVGHLRKVIQMIERGTSLPRIVQQLYAVESAPGKARTTVFVDRLDKCLDAVVAQ